MNPLATRTIDKPKIRFERGDQYREVNRIVQSQRLHTVCEEARCPNIYECWNRRTATIMILGDTCTRSCGFCSVKTGRPTWQDPLEPERTARAVRQLDLRHVVITSVDRDDLKPDFGATIWAETIRRIRQDVPNCTVEVLTPDFQGNSDALNTVFAARPDIFSHNIECVERISRQVRPQADWRRSLNVLQASVKAGLRTKTGLMVGLGETVAEVFETMQQAAELGVEIFTIGQYLQPSKKQVPVARYVSREEFQDYQYRGLEMGFRVVESGPLVRSSYHADEQAQLSGVTAGTNNE
ncbi:MAG: lipoyl synthase [FCB group bacterium]|nr:lipoyl synthase [FCB group bacterium]